MVADAELESDRVDWKHWYVSLTHVSCKSITLSDLFYPSIRYALRHNNMRQHATKKRIFSSPTELKKLLLCLLRPPSLTSFDHQQQRVKRGPRSPAQKEEGRKSHWFHQARERGKKSPQGQTNWLTSPLLFCGGICTHNVLKGRKKKVCARVWERKKKVRNFGKTQSFRVKVKALGAIKAEFLFLLLLASGLSLRLWERFNYLQ